MKTTKTAAEINAIMQELVSYTELQEQPKAEIESLQDEGKPHKQATGQDEIITEDDIKCTWRQTTSNSMKPTNNTKRDIEM